MKEELPIKSIAPQPDAIVLVQEFAQERIRQCQRYDELGRDLIKLPLAIAGIYVSALEWGGDHSWILRTPGFFLCLLALISWIAAALCSLRAVFPRKYEVMEDVPYRIDPAPPSGPITIKEFYDQSAAFKRACLQWSIGLFIGGILFASISLFYHEPPGKSADNSRTMLEMRK